MFDVHSPVMSRQSMTRAVAALVYAAVPILRTRYGLAPEAAQQAACELAQAFYERAGCRSVRPNRRKNETAGFIGDVVECARDVLRDTVGIAEADTAPLAERIAEAICTRLARCTVPLPRADFLLHQGVFELPPPSRDITTMHLSPAQFVGWLIVSAAEVLQSARPTATASTVARAARELAYRVCERHEGCVLYVPLPQVFALRRRNALILQSYAADSPASNGAKKFTGARVQELAREHGLTAQAVYALIRKARDSHSAQPPGGAARPQATAEPHSAN